MKYEKWEIDERFRNIGYKSVLEAARETVNREIPAAYEDIREQLALRLESEIYKTGDSIDRCWLRIR